MKPDLSECSYIVETYIDEYKTLCQNIAYEAKDTDYRDYLQTTINPNLKLSRKQYFKKNDKYPGTFGELIFTEYFK